MHSVPLKNVEEEEGEYAISAQRIRSSVHGMTSKSSEAQLHRSIRIVRYSRAIRENVREASSPQVRIVVVACRISRRDEEHGIQSRILSCRFAHSLIVDYSSSIINYAAHLQRDFTIAGRARFLVWLSILFVGASIGAPLLASGSRIDSGDTTIESSWNIVLSVTSRIFLGNRAMALVDWVVFAQPLQSFNDFVLPNRKQLAQFTFVRNWLPRRQELNLVRQHERTSKEHYDKRDKRDTQQLTCNMSGISSGFGGSSILFVI